MKKINAILFVCLGNICRSPLAEGIARDLAQKRGMDLKIDSAGTSGWHIGESPDSRSIEVAKNNGIDISCLKGRKVNAYNDDSFDLIVAMDRQNYQDLLRFFSKDKVVLMGDYGLEGRDIPDPYHYKDLEGFKKIYEMLYLAINRLYDEISECN
ncbi:low molecular weight protein-tyrosine-phosphatase [Helicobacter apodemus]|uniref:protein-tyrosine-phosphatase n=1 Tax=Helicobacter apodemus TaxID=135569 RepID=A0A2U8FEZ4_9HELI|nr:low molecular weight protein-tyrosine-phosphatase [Helicobacter apodemus]AWI33995.1 protein tyrosine phosphatase [Helicobacter apodemus]